MNEENKDLGHDRVIFMKACTEMKLSEEIQLLLSKVIRIARVTFGEHAGDEKALELIELIKNKSEPEIVLELTRRESEKNIKDIFASMDDDLFETIAANYLRGLGFTWITIASAMSDEVRENTLQLLKNNPTITKEDFLAITNIKEFKYHK